MDWNRDGRHDLLVGDTEGHVRIYLNTSNDDYPILSGNEPVRAGGVNIDVGDRATPAADDWNGDGKKDLLVGAMDGTIQIYLNVATDSEPVFDSFHLLQVNGKDFDIGSRSAPRVYDWNKDGLNDLLIGEMQGHVYYLKNTGTNTAPVFNRAGKLFLRNGSILRYPAPAGSARSRLFVTDWNNDGLTDIILGGRDGKIILYQAAPAPSSSPPVLFKKLWVQSRETVVTSIKQFKDIIRAMKSRVI